MKSFAHMTLSCPTVSRAGSFWERKGRVSSRMPTLTDAIHEVERQKPDSQVTLTCVPMDAPLLLATLVSFSSNSELSSDPASCELGMQPDFGSRHSAAPHDVTTCAALIRPSPAPPAWDVAAPRASPYNDLSS